MKNHFYMAYAGNKRLEVENLYKFLNLNDVTDIVEPFCGSCAMSFYISLQQPNKFRYFLNDKNNYLKEMFDIIRDDFLLNKFENELKIKIDFVKGNKENYNLVVKENNVMGWFIKNKFYSIRGGLYPSKEENKFKFKSLRDYPIFNFFRNENIIFSTDDGLNVYNKFKQNKNALLLLDPPYIHSNNTFYTHRDITIYEYLYDNNIDDEQAIIVLILENNLFIKLLFKNKTISEYDKKYETSHKTTKHIIVANNKLL